MIHRARLQLLAVALSLSVSVRGLGQEPAPLPPPTPVSAGEGEVIVSSLPNVPELPASLTAAAPPPSTVSPQAPLDMPYFMPDPVLDPPQFPAPGWFGGAEVDIVHPHIKSGLTDTVQNSAQAAAGTATTVALPVASLDWTVSPRVFVGYRLPAGFGEISLGYRGLASDGNEQFEDVDGLAPLRTRLDFNVIDLDYASREFSLWPHCEMKWIVGIRTLFLFFDSQSVESFAEAAAGSGIFQMRESNNLWGMGVHTGLELSQRVPDTGISLVARGDITSYLGKLHQNFFTLSTTLGPDGEPLAGETREENGIAAPIVSFQVGVNWQPESYKSLTVFLGYQYEYWWEVGNLIIGSSRADISDQGIVLEAAFRY